MIEKLHEELAEFDEARRNAVAGELEDELGDMLFVLVNLARFVKVDPEQALRKTNAKFRERFGYIERRLAERGASLDGIEYRGNGGAVAGSRRASVIEIRQLFRPGRVQDVLELQKMIWGFADIELLPLRFLVVVSKVGGHVFGAYDGERMVGFCFAIPGVKPGGTAVPAQPHAGRAAGVPQRRHRAAAEAARSGRTRWRAASS